MPERTFEEAAAAVKTLKEDPGNDAKLRLYGSYKMSFIELGVSIIQTHY